ncbi:lipoprotein [soil metagenome]
MKTNLFFLTLILIIAGASVLNAQAPSIGWQKTIGGDDNDSLTSIQPTADGGSIACGISKSNISGNKSQQSFNNSYDYWVVKLKPNGSLQWEKTIGGNGPDLNPVIIQTPDGGFLIGGRSKSNISGLKTEDAINFSNDYWVIKIDKDGSYQWDNTLGNIQLEAARGLALTTDGGYIIAGYAHSNNGYDKSELNRGSSVWADYWLVKLDKKGRVKWNKTYGGGNEDILTCITATTDGGFVMGGHSYSPAEFEKTDSFLGNCDYWIVKIDSSGNKLWDKVYGGIFSDYQTSIAQTADGGFILGGYSNSPASFSKTGSFRGVTDYWIIKTDAAGNKQWDKTIGGTGGDYLYAVQQTADKGYILGGSSNSDAMFEKSENSKGFYDNWIVKLDASGNLQWDKTYGGALSDKLSGIREISANQYVLGAASNSGVSGDKSAGTVSNSGLNDFWILRLTGAAGKQSAQQSVNAIAIGTIKSAAITRQVSMQVSPNPTSNTAVVSYDATTGKKVSLMVYDITGNVIINKDLANKNGIHTVDLTRFAAGTYYFVLSSNQSTITSAVIKK